MNPMILSRSGRAAVDQSPVYDFNIPQGMIPTTPPINPNETDPLRLAQHWKFVSGKRLAQIELAERMLQYASPGYQPRGARLGLDPIVGLRAGGSGGDLPSPVGYRSSIGQAWLAEGLLELVRLRQAFAAMTPLTEVVVNNASAIMHGYSTLAEITMAYQAASRGAIAKNFSANTGVAAAATAVSNPLNADQFSVGGVNLATGTGTSVVSGWRLRITGSELNFSFRPIEVAIGIPTVTTGNVTLTAANTVASFVLLPRRLPLDVLVLSVANGGGYFSMVPGRSGGTLGNTDPAALDNVCVVRSLGDANTFVTFESLNSRDLLSRIAPSGEVSADEAIRDFLQAGARDGFVQSGARDA